MQTSLNMSYYKEKIRSHKAKSKDHKEEVRRDIRELRTNKGYTQKEVAEALGMTQQHYGAYYENQSDATVDFLIQCLEEMEGKLK